MGLAMSDKLSWAEIKRRYDQHWVVLVEHDWDTTEPMPKAGVVKHYCKTKGERNDFLKKHKAELDDIALVYVGEPKEPENTFISANTVRYR